MTERVLQLNREKTIFWALIWVLLLGMGFYMYFINTTVHNVVARQNNETEATRLTMAIGSQEFKYIEEKNAVTLELAYSLGFKETDQKTFIAQGKSAGQVSYNSR